MANRRFIDFPIASTVGDSDIILIWQDGANKQTTKATILSGLPENLDELNDVVISGLTNGQILRYDSVTGKWENTDQGNLDLNDLNDVSIVSPSNGQVLVYNSSTSKWENSSGGFVPYVGAVTTVDLGAQGLRAGYVRFDTTVAGVPNEQGLMFWDADDETVDIILNGYTMKIGEDLFYPVKNQTGSTIAKGVAVRFNGTVGNSGRLLIAPFIADGSVPSTRFMGVTAEEILNGEDGKVLYFGRVRGINTNAFNEGDILYASTTVAGGYQTAIPVAPNNIVQVAAVVTKSATVGTIFVRPTLGSNINKDEGVKITSVADKNLLQYQSGTSLWENKSLAQVIGSDYVPSTRTITINGVSQDLSANRTYNVGTVTSVGLSSATSGVTIGGSPVTGVGTFTLAIATASGSQNGLLSSTDWTTFNNKQNALTNPVTGTGTTNYLPKFTGSTTIGNSSIADNGSGRVSVGTGNFYDSFVISNAATTGWEFSNSGSVITYNRSTAAYIPMTFEASNYILNRGNLGLGVTPSSWNSAYRAMQFGTTGAIFGESGDAANYFTTNTFVDSVGFKYITSDWALGYFQENGVHSWRNAPSGTAGNAISFTQAMTLTSGGNLLVGTTTDNGARLQVSGRTQISGGSLDSSTLTDLGIVSALTNGRSGTFQSNSLASISTRGDASSIELIAGVSSGFYTGISATANNASTFAGVLRLLTAGSERMRITSGGNVGIGTASPAGLLEINGLTFVNNTGDSTARLLLRNSTTGANAGGLDIREIGVDASLNNASNGYLSMSTNNTERMRITSGGNVLIGTTTDNGARLQVSETAQISGTPPSTNGGLLNIRDSVTATNVTSFAGVFFNSSPGNDYSIGKLTENGSGFLQIRNANSGTELLRINSTGAATFSSSVTTGAPAGGTAQPWKLGTVATVSPTSPNRTIEVEVNGTTYYLHAKTTNN